MSIWNYLHRFGGKKTYIVSSRKRVQIEKGGGLKKNSGKDCMPMDKLVNQMGNEEIWVTAVL